MGTWIEIKIYKKTALGFNRRSLRGNVDRNLIEKNNTDTLIGRSLRGNVDRNTEHGLIIGLCCASFPTWERG